MSCTEKVNVWIYVGINSHFYFWKCAGLINSFLKDEKLKISPQKYKSETNPSFH